MEIPPVQIGFEYEFFRAELASKIRNNQVVSIESNGNHTCYFCNSPIKRKPVRLLVIEDLDHPGKSIEDKFAVHEHCYNEAMAREY